MNQYKILIVDDEEAVRSSIIQKIQWEALGFSVVGDAENGEEALEKVRVLEPDLVLTDIKMPYMDGLTLVKHIKKIRNSTEIIIFSGFDDFEYAQQAIGLNVIEYILKPVNAEELTEILIKVRQRMDKKIAEMRDIQSLRVNYTKMLPVFKEHFCCNWVQGELEEEAIREQLKRIEPELQNKKHFVVATTYIEVASSVENQPSKYWQDDQDLIPLSVKQVLSEKLQRTFSFMTFGLVSRIGMICGLEEDKEFSELLEQLNQVCLDCKKILGITVTFGVGELYNQLLGVKKSYDEAQNALGYRLTLGTGGVIYNGDVEIVERGILQLDTKSEGKLIQAVKFGSKDNVKEVIRQLMDKMKEAKVHTNQYQVYITGIINVLTQLAQKHEIPICTIWGKEDYFKVIARLVTLEGMENFILNSALIIHEKIDEGRHKSMKTSIGKAKQYILENFQNPDLSVEMVCEHVHMSQAYFSTLFKKETGQTYISFLTETRLNEALELLHKTDDKTYIIASKVGYTEPNYFSYVFKKKFGVAPSRYQRKVSELKKC